MRTPTPTPTDTTPAETGALEKMARGPVELSKPAVLALIAQAINDAARSGLSGRRVLTELHTQIDQNFK